VLCVEFIVVTATVLIVQSCCVVLEFILVTATVVIVQWQCVVLEFNMVTAAVGIVQWYCAVCGDYWGYNNSRYVAMVLGCEWSFLW